MKQRHVHGGGWSLAHRGVLGLLLFGVTGCAGRTVGDRERRDDHQVRWLARDSVRVFREPERFPAYVRRMSQRLAPSEIHRSQTLDQIRESREAWRVMLGMR